MINKITNADVQNAEKQIDMILSCYGVRKRYYLSEHDDYTRLVGNLAATLLAAYDNGYAAGTAKAGN